MKLTRDERRILVYLKRREEFAADGELIGEALGIPARKVTNAILSLAEKRFVHTEDGRIAVLSHIGRDCDIIRSDAGIDRDLNKEPGHSREVFAYIHDHPFTAVGMVSSALEIPPYTVEDAVVRLEQIGIPARDRIA